MSLAGQTMPVRGLAFSPDGRRLAGAAGGYDAQGRSSPGDVLVWDLEQRRLIMRLRGHPQAVLSVAVSPDGRWLASADSHGAVRIWDAARGNEIAVLQSLEDPGVTTVECLAFSPDSRLLAAGGAGRSIRVWDASRWDAGGRTPRQPLFTLLHPSPVHSIAFSPDGRVLAAAYGDHTVRAWHLATRTIGLTLRGHTDAVTSVAFSPDGWRLASASQDLTIKVWDATGDRETVPLRDRLKGNRKVEALAFSRDGRWLASASADRAVRIWDVSTGLVVRTFRGHAERIDVVAFSPDGQRLASAGEDRAVIIWTLASGEPHRTMTGFPKAVQGIAFSPDGRWLACSTGGWKSSGTVQLRSLRGDGEIIALADGPDHAAQPGFHKVAFSPDGRWLAAGCDDATIRVWDLAARRPARVLSGHSGPVLDVAFSPDGRRLASASDDRSVKLWDATTGATIATLSSHTGQVSSIAFSPDGRRLASAGQDFTVKLWDPRTLEEDPRAQEIESLGVGWRDLSVAFHPDGRRLAIGGALAILSDLDRSSFPGHLGREGTRPRAQPAG